jgi:hypothetical protein
MATPNSPHNSPTSQKDTTPDSVFSDPPKFTDLSLLIGKEVKHFHHVEGRKNLRSYRRLHTVPEETSKPGQYDINVDLFTPCGCEKQQGVCTTKLMGPHCSERQRSTISSQLKDSTTRSAKYNIFEICSDRPGFLKTFFTTTDRPDWNESRIIYQQAVDCAKFQLTTRVPLLKKINVTPSLHISGEYCKLSSTQQAYTGFASRKNKAALHFYLPLTNTVDKDKTYPSTRIMTLIGSVRCIRNVCYHLSGTLGYVRLSGHQDFSPSNPLINTISAGFQEECDLVSVLYKTTTERPTTKGVLQMLSSLKTLAAVPGQLSGAADTVTGAAESLSGTTTRMSSAMDNIKSVLSNVSGFVGGIWKVIMGFFETITNVISSMTAGSLLLSAMLASSLFFLVYYLINWELSVFAITTMVVSLLTIYTSFWPVSAWYKMQILSWVILKKTIPKLSTQQAEDYAKEIPWTVFLRCGGCDPALFRQVGISLVKAHDDDPEVRRRFAKHLKDPNYLMELQEGDPEESDSDDDLAFPWSDSELEEDAQIEPDISCYDAQVPSLAEGETQAWTPTGLAVLASMFVGMFTLGKDVAPSLKTVVNIGNTFRAVENIDKGADSMAQLLLKFSDWLPGCVTAYFETQYPEYSPIFGQENKLWYEAVIEITTKHTPAEILYDARFRKHVLQTVEETHQFLKDHGPKIKKSPSSWTILQKLVSRLEPFEDACEDKAGIEGFRNPPFVVCLTGATRVGKSTLCSRIAFDLAPDQIPPNHCVYSMTDGLDHMDGYTGQYCTHFDDFATYDDMTQPLMFMQMCSSAPMHVPMAAIDKGNAAGVKGTMFTSEMITMATNTPYPEFAAQKNTEALWSRRNRLVEVRLLAECADRVDMNGITVHVPDWPAIRTMFNDDDIMQNYPHLRFHLMSPNRPGIVLTRRPMTYAQLVARLKMDKQEHEDLSKLARRATDFGRQLLNQRRDKMIADDLLVPGTKGTQFTGQKATNRTLLKATTQMEQEGYVTAEDVKVEKKQTTSSGLAPPQTMTVRTKAYNERLGREVTYDAKVTKHLTAKSKELIDPPPAAETKLIPPPKTRKLTLVLEKIDGTDLLKKPLATSFPDLTNDQSLYELGLLPWLKQKTAGLSFVKTILSLLAGGLMLYATVKGISRLVKGKPEQQTYTQKTGKSAPKHKWAPGKLTPGTKQFFSDELSSVAARSLLSYAFYDKDGVLLGAGCGWNVKGTMHCVPYHYLMECPDIDTVLVKRPNSVCIVKWDNVTWRQLTRNGKGVDLALMDLGVPGGVGRDFTSHLPTVDDLPDLSHFKSYVAETTPNGVMMTELRDPAYHLDVAETVTFDIDGNSYAPTHTVTYEGNFSKGDCGSLIMTDRSRSGRIVAMHTGAFKPGIWSNKYGTAELLTQDLFEDCEAYLVSQECELNVEPSRVQPTANSVLQLLGAVKKEQLPRTSNNTSLEPSPLFERVPVATPHRMEPAAQGYNKALGLTALTRSMQKLDVKTLPPDSVLLEEAVSSLKDEILAFPPVSGLAGLMTEDQLTNGVPGVEYARALDFTTSEGYPYLLDRPKGQKGKHWLFTGEPTKRTLVNKKCRQRLTARCQLAEEGKLASTIWVGQAKDEKRPIQKVKDMKTRLFSNPPLDYLMACKKYLNTFCMAFYKQHGRCFSAVGIDPHSPEWEQMWARLLRVSPKGFAGDWSCWDGTMRPEMLQACIEIINEWYQTHDKNHNPRHDRARAALLSELSNCTILIEGHLYKTYQGHPSGGSMTSILNTMVNEMLIRMSFVWKNPTISLELWNRNIATTIFGDDNVVAVHPELPFTGKDLSDYADTMGLKYTDASKTGDQTDKLQDLLTLDFLSCSTRCDGENLYACLKEEALIGMVNWKQKAVTRTDYLEAMSRDLSRFLWFYGKDVHDKWRVQIRKALSKKGWKSPFPTFTSLQKRATNEISLWPKLHLGILQMGDNSSEEPVASPDEPISVLPIAESTTMEAQKETALTVHGMTITNPVGETGVTVIPENDPVDDSVRDIAWSVAAQSEKPHLKTNLTWVTTQIKGTILHAWSIPKDVIAGDQMGQPFDTFAFFRGTSVFKFQLAGTNFRIGQLIAWYVQGTADVDLTSTSYYSWKTLRTATYLPNCLMLATDSTPVTMKIPFVWGENYMETTSLKSMGVVYLAVLNQLRIGAEAMDGVSVTITSFFEKTAFRVPRVVPASSLFDKFLGQVMGLQDESMDTVRSKVRQALLHLHKKEELRGYTRDHLPLAKGELQGNAGSTVTQYKFGDMIDSTIDTEADGGGIPIDIDASVATGGSTAAGQGGSAQGSEASLDKPGIGHPSMTMFKVPFYNLNHSRGCETVQKCTLEPTAAVGAFGTTFGQNPRPYNNLSGLLQVESVHHTFMWKTDQIANKIIHTGVLSPFKFLEDSTPNDQNRSGGATMIDVLSAPFSCWRGTYYMVFQVISSTFHRGKLLVSAGYGTTTPFVSDTLQNCYGAVLTLDECAKTFIVEVPFVSPTTWKYVPCGQAHSRTAVGVWALSVYNVLRAPATVPQTIDINVWVYCGPDFQLSQLGLNNTSLQTSAVTPIYTIVAAVDADPTAEPPVEAVDAYLEVTRYVDQSEVLSTVPQGVANLEMALAMGEFQMSDKKETCGTDSTLPKPKDSPNSAMTNSKSDGPAPPPWVFCLGPKQPKLDRKAHFGNDVYLTIPELCKRDTYLGRYKMNTSGEKSNNIKVEKIFENGLGHDSRAGLLAYYSKIFAGWRGHLRFKFLLQGLDNGAVVFVYSPNTIGLAFDNEHAGTVGSHTGRLLGRKAPSLDADGDINDGGEMGSTFAQAVALPQSPYVQLEVHPTTVFNYQTLPDSLAYSGDSPRLQNVSGVITSSGKLTTSDPVIIHTWVSAGDNFVFGMPCAVPYLSLPSGELDPDEYTSA